MILQINKETLLRLESNFKMWKLMFIRLEYLRTDFFLERLSTERDKEGRQNLIDAAQEIMHMIVFLWLERNPSSSRHFDYDYIASSKIFPS
jgi:hypothetical protein